jgi:hypothetical protein
LDGLDYFRVVVTDVDIDKLRGPVKITLAVTVPEVYPIAPRHRDGVPSGLGLPAYKRVLTILVEDFLVVH